MTKEELKNEVIAAARKTWEEQGSAVLAALGGSVSRDEVVEGLLTSGAVATHLSEEAAAQYRALPRLLKCALLTLAFPDDRLSARGGAAG